MSTYVIKTWLGTFIYYDYQTERLRHAPAGHIKHILLVQHENGTISFKFSPEPPADLLAHRLRLGEYTISGTSLSDFNLKIDHFLCAEASGLVVADRAVAADWETFSLVPLEDVSPLLGRDLAPPEQIISLPRSYGIPPLLHQIYINNVANLKNKAGLPEVFTENVHFIQQQNPEFCYRLWTTKDIYDAIYDWYGFEILRSYLRINPRYVAAQADFFRYLLMYKCGGVYLDLKSSLSKPLSEIISTGDGYLLSHWNDFAYREGVGLHSELSLKPRGEYQQWFIICEPGHPYLESVISQVLENIATYSSKAVGFGKLAVLRTTGPIPYTLGIDRVLDSARYRMIKSESEGLVFCRVHGGLPFLGRHYSELREDLIL